ncbi:hypothetical protein HDU86_000636 [Geranomyces michiganensis]|nr:hypothetical protein HDU86_000636 [Geranomyces michiganensis]
MSHLYALVHGDTSHTELQPYEDGDHVALAIIVFKLKCGVDCKGNAEWMRELKEQRLRGSEYAVWGTVELDAEAHDRRLEYVQNFAANLVMPHHAKQKGFDILETTLHAAHPSQKPNTHANPPSAITRTACVPTPTRADTYVRYEQAADFDTAGEYHEPYAAILDAASDFLGWDPHKIDWRVSVLENALQKEIEWIHNVLVRGAQSRQTA